VKWCGATWLFRIMVTHLTMWNDMVRCNNGAMQQWCDATMVQCNNGAMHKDHNASMVMLHRNNMRVVFKHGGNMLHRNNMVMRVRDVGGMFAVMLQRTINTTQTFQRNYPSI
jgi:hypothetical protein